MPPPPFIKWSDLNPTFPSALLFFNCKILLWIRSGVENIPCSLKSEISIILIKCPASLVSTQLYKVLYFANNSSITFLSPCALSITLVVTLLAGLIFFNSFQKCVLLDMFSANFSFWIFNWLFFQQQPHNDTDAECAS